MNWAFGSVMLQPRARAAWLSEFSNGARSMQAAIDSVPYAVATRGPQRDSALFSVGLNVVLNPRALLYADYTAQSVGIVKYLSDWRLGAAVRFRAPPRGSLQPRPGFFAPGGSDAAGWFGDTTARSPRLQPDELECGRPRPPHRPPALPGRARPHRRDGTKRVSSPFQL